MAKKTTEQRFWEKVDKTGNCWLWTAGRKGSYGTFRCASAGHYAHRYSYILHFGAVPDGMLVCHKCDNGRCVRPDHLFIGTHADNMADRNRKGRARGGGHHTPIKLTADQVRSIRSEYASGVFQIELARRYDVHPNTISAVIYRRIWAHI
jgi:hypothetical protein